MGSEREEVRSEDLRKEGKEEEVSFVCSLILLAPVE